MRDIAIIGMSCRFPGARDLTDFWRLASSTERQFRPVPAARWDHSRYFDPDDRRSDSKSYTDRVAYLDRVDEFDAVHYRMSPRRVRNTDPQHRLLLDVAREAVQDAGWERRPYDAVNTGVYFALSSAEFNQLTPGAAGIDPYAVPGSLLNMAAATVSQHFDLGGPSFTVDSACSSGLTALHEAVTALRAGVCTEALVGGAYLSLAPVGLVGFSRVGALSTAGVCRPFDRRADGFVLGEGVGVVVLRPLAAALAAGDRVYAVIRGIGCSNDGTADGPMTPREDGQVRAMTRAYSDAGVAPGSVGLIEAHGTATVVGDRVELSSLTRVRAGDDAARPVPPAYLTSIKALVGHALTASGLASLIKTTLALHHGTIPPQPATDVEDAARLERAGLRLPATAVPWPADPATPRRAGINSFGFGGTNVHVVLEEAPEPPAPEPAEPRPELFVFTAGTIERLDGYLRRFLDWADREGLGTADDLTRLAATLGTRRPLRARLAIVAASWPELRARIEAALPRLAGTDTGRLDDGVYLARSTVRDAARVVAFVYPGQGSQRPDMLRDLYDRFPVFAAAANRLDDRVRTGSGFSALDAVYGADADTEAGRHRLTGTDVCQPALGILGVAATRLLARCGVTPDVALGHSVGEFPAAVAAGALPDDAAVTMMARRGAAMRAAEATERGGMLAVQAGPDRVAELLDGIAGLWPACYNHPRQTVVAGTVAALAEFEQRLAAERIGSQPLTVSNAFHTPLLDSARDEIRAAVPAAAILPPTRTFVSSVSGTGGAQPAELAELWRRHAGAPVRFADAARTAYQAGARIFVQVLGGSALLRTVRQNLRGRTDCHYVSVTGEGPDDARSFLTGLAQLVTLGVDVDGSGITAAPGRLLSPPVTPLANRSYPTPPWPDVDALLHPETDPAGQLAGRTGAGDPAGVRSNGATVPVRPGPPAADATAGAPNAAGRPKPPQAPAGSRPPDASSARAGSRPTQVPVAASQEDQPVSELVNLFREQIALLRSLDPGATNASRAAAEPDRPQPDAATADRRLVGAADPRLVAAAADPRPVATPAPGSAVMSGRDEVATVVYREVARISAFPVDHFTGTELLVQELGFDSLMVTELLSALTRIWPALAGAGTDLPARPTLREMVDAIAEIVRPGDTVPAAAAALGGHPPAAPAPDPTPPAVSEPRPPEPGPGAVTPERGLADMPELAGHDEELARLGRNPYFLTHEGNARQTTRIDGQELVSFSSYNYLGLSGHPQVNEAVFEAVRRYGTSVSASRFLSGNRPLHDELEVELAALLGAEACLAMVSGHATNVSVIGHLVGPGDLIVHDELAHDSILQGCALSGATRRPFAHNDPAALDAVLGRHRPRHRRCLVVVEGVYSMDGDIAQLPELIAVKQRHGALLMVDEAHSIGTVGANGGGVGEHFDVDRSTVDIWSGTLSKSLASCGGYVAGARTLIEYLRYTVPGFVYSVGMTPANTAAALGALRAMRAEPARLARLTANSRLFLDLARKAGIDTGTSRDSPVVPCIVGDSARCLALCHALFDRGISVNPIMYPGVPEELARLRFFVTSEHTTEQLERTVQVVAEELGRLRTPLAPTPA
ncbi:aminotransferase class I/II-fold pyridoxal phosphate-dependent enzyme [Actinocatenispora sera]|uniref:aminotransferase class I/II-fold pyridoxal phosphate-dependent enzyme n=1 Tax=Actinocatenispora sera TaxID=390989 RepID=UPI00340FA3C4